MARGKHTCKILKEIRQQIAEANDIEFVTSECRFKGDCLGTCPKCEAEAHYLEQMLLHRKQKGKAITLTGISAGLLAMVIPATAIAQPPQENQELSNYGTPCPCDTINVNGVVGDTVEVDGESSFEPLIGATITNKTNKKITTSDLYGKFNIKACKGDSLEICYVGYDTETLVVTDDMKDISITLSPSQAIFGEISTIPAEFPGGMSALMDFISQNLKYPSDMAYADRCIEGRVIVKFMVDTLGNVCNPKVIKGIDPSFDKEALRVVGMLPSFYPSTDHGKPINSYYCLPVRWKIKDSQKIND